MFNLKLPHQRIRLLLLFFIIALLASGLTAFPLEWELKLLHQTVSSSPLANIFPDLVVWISRVNLALQNTYRDYPFLAYGTDWLAFAHIVIAIAFIGPLCDPVKNIWVVEFDMIACVLVIPFALIMGAIRGIPFFWTLIDCSFGIFGIIPLWLVRSDILQIETLSPTNHTNQL